MLVTVLGIMTLLTAGRFANAELPILVTGQPLVVSGIATVPPGPVYLVIWIAPLLVVKVNWPCATMGSITSRRNCSCFMTLVGLRAIAEQVIIQVWISTHFGVLSEQLPVAEENSRFIKATFTPAPVPL